MKKFFKAVTAISAALVSIYGILALIDKLRNRQSDVIYFDSKDGEEE